MNRKSDRQDNIFFGLLCLALVGAGGISLLLGATKISPQELFAFFRGKLETPATYNIIAYVRLPRTAAAMLAGAALSLSGALLQTVLGNPMASPNVIGVNAGAGLATTLCMWLFPHQAALFPLAAFGGALATALVIYLLAAQTGASRTTLVLTGLALSSILTAGIHTVHTFFPEVMIGTSQFRMGDFSFVTPAQLRFATPYIILGMGLALLFRYELTMLTLGDPVARSLGLAVGKYRFLFILVAAMLAGAAVSFAGLLGFVGLLVPHMVRLFTQDSPGLFIPASIVGGATFLVLCDTLTRTLFAPYEFPVGIFMSFLGGPFFLWMVSTQRGKKYARR